MRDEKSGIRCGARRAARSAFISQGEMNFQRRMVPALALVALLAATSAQAVTIDWTTIGNAGNTADGNGRGSVANDFRIATYEVTNNQYAEFLNAVDPTGANTLQLYSNGMSGDPNGGINFTPGNANGNKYTIKTGQGQQPVVYVSWYDGIRFANWLHNGQGSGDTETGAYTLGTLGAGAVPVNGSSITRNPGASVFLPNADEWYKAAYYDASGTPTYYDYPTGSNSAPNSYNPTGSLPALPIQQNAANYYRWDGTIDGVNDGYAMSGSQTLPTGSGLTDVGAYTLSPSPYGTFDQGGNAMEWTESLNGAGRIPQGGTWKDDYYLMGAWYLPGANDFDPTMQLDRWGFRVAAVVPEPGTGLLATMACIGLAILRRRKATLGA